MNPFRRLNPRWRRHRSRALLLLGVVAFGVAGQGVQFLHRGFVLEEAFDRYTARGFLAAEPYLKRAADLQPGDAELIKTLAIGYVSKGREEEALPYLTRWYELCPDDDRPVHWRMSIFVRRRKLPQAIADARRLLDMGWQDDYALHMNLAQWLADTGQYAEAESHCRWCAEQPPRQTEPLLLHARICCQTGNKTTAAALAERLMREFPAYAEAWMLRAELHVEAGRADEAMALLRHVADHHGTDQDALRRLQVLLEQANRHDEARNVEAELLQRVANDIDREYLSPSPAPPASQSVVLPR